MSFDADSLKVKSKEILDANWKGKYSIPSPRLYPHQWSWDSAFTARGYSNYDQNRAQSELMSVFDGQWQNGMVPHIIFRSSGDYFPGPDIWHAHISPNAPKTVETSGITHPAVHAIAAFSIYQAASDKESARKFLADIYPRILNFHRYLFYDRDPEKSGLITILHPWESGLDNSIRWDDSLNRIEFEKITSNYRVDITRVNPKERPDDRTYDRFIHLLELMRDGNYDETKIYQKMPFKVKDVIFSSIAYTANQNLLKIAGIISQPKAEIETWLRRTRRNYFNYFCPEKSRYRLVYDYDLITNERIIKPTAASLISLYTDLLSHRQAQFTLDWLKHSHTCDETCNHAHPVVSSVSFQSADFNPLNYWRGPIWININWMMYQGLLNYGFREAAQLLRTAILELVGEHGFYEYYNPLTGDGLGADNFSWTAALTIDLLSSFEDQLPPDISPRDESL